VLGKGELLILKLQLIQTRFLKAYKQAVGKFTLTYRVIELIGFWTTAELQMESAILEAELPSHIPDLKQLVY
jgi:hypothetical protein